MDAARARLVDVGWSLRISRVLRVDRRVLVGHVCALHVDVLGACGVAAFDAAVLVAIAFETGAQVLIDALNFDALPAGWVLLRVLEDAAT